MAFSQENFRFLACTDLSGNGNPVITLLNVLSWINSPSRRCVLPNSQTCSAEVAPIIISDSHIPWMKRRKHSSGIPTLPASSLYCCFCSFILSPIAQNWFSSLFVKWEKTLADWTRFQSSTVPIFPLISQIVTGGI